MDTDPQLERTTLESKVGTFALEEREYLFDQALRLKSGLTIAGNGATWESQSLGAFPLSCSAYLWGDGAGWIDKIERVDETKAGPRVTLTFEHELHNYTPGTLVYAWAAGQGDGLPRDHTKFGLVNQRRTVVKRDGDGIILNEPIDPRCNALVWLRGGVPIQNVKDGEWMLTTNAVMGQYWLTSGKSSADELRGEWVTLYARTAGGSPLRLPASRDYATAALAMVQPVENTRIDRVIFAKSPQPLGNSFFGKFARGLIFTNCTFLGQFGLAAATDCQFVDCTFLGGLQLNTTTRMMFDRCRFTVPPAPQMQACAFNTDEADSDTLVQNSEFYDCDNGVRSGVDCHRFRMFNCRFRNIRSSAFLLGGKDNLLEKIRIHGENISWLHGPRLKIRDYKSTGRAVVYGGINQTIEDMWPTQLTLGWVNGGPSGGVVRDSLPVSLSASAVNYIVT